MTQIKFFNCPSTLKHGFSTFSPKALKQLFAGKKVSHFLNFSIVNSYQSSENIQRISISGVQEKYSLILDKNELRKVNLSEKGQYILKPIPINRFYAVNDIPANEHLTMQIAKQVYGIETAINTIVFFKDNTTAYLTKRFDYQLDNEKLMMEDFASLAGKTIDKRGESLKYEGSYEDMATLIKQNVKAYTIEIEKFFYLVLFNYLFSNGDAHLKNFSLIETVNGDMVLAPAYDLLCSRLHVNDADLAMQDGLFSDEFKTESFKANAYYAHDDFVSFGNKIGITKSRIVKIIQFFQKDHALNYELISNSFLTEESKEIYRDLYLEKLKRFRYVF